MAKITDPITKNVWKYRVGDEQNYSSYSSNLTINKQHSNIVGQFFNGFTCQNDLNQAPQDSQGWV